MDLFRRKQKLIFWIVTIIIVPSFILVWGNRSPQGGGGGGGELARINGSWIDFQEFNRFRTRFIAAIGEQPFRVAGAMENQAIPGLWDILWIYYLADEAERAGIAVSENSIGSYLRQQHPSIAQKYREDPSPAALDKAVSELCARNQITRTEFMRGVREWLAVGRYVELDQNTTIADRDTAYILYAIDRSEFDFKRIRVEPDADIREQARKDVLEKPAADLEAAVRAHIGNRPDDQRFRDPATWRFAYILVPFASDDQAKPATDREMEAQYETYKSALYAGLTFEEARGAVAADLARQERERRTLRNLSVDIDPQLRENGDLDPAELAKLTQFAKHGAKAGDTGPEPLTAVQIATGGPFGPVPELVSLLDMFDRFPPANRESEAENWKSGTGFLFLGAPMRSESGFLRLRLLAYNPSSPVETDDADGNIKPELFETALADLVAERISGLTLEKAENLQAEVAQFMEARRAGGDAPSGMAELIDGLPAETRRYREISDPGDYEFGRMAVDEVRGPLAVAAREGPVMSWDIVVLTERRVPNRASFAAEPETVWSEYDGRDRSNRSAIVGYAFADNMLVRTLQPSEAMRVAFYDKYIKGEIAINRELQRAPEF